MPQPYSSKINDFITNMILQARKKQRELIPTQEQFDEETQQILRNDPNYVEARNPDLVHGPMGDFNRSQIQEMNVGRPTGNPVLDTLFSPFSGAPAAAGAVIGGAGKFGEEGKAAKALLDEWRNLGLKNFKLSDAEAYLKASPEELLKGHPIAAQVAEAGGNPLKHLPDAEIESALQKLYPDNVNFITQRPASASPGAPDINLMNTTPAPAREFTGVPAGFNPPQTPEDWRAFEESIPSTANVPSTPAIQDPNVRPLSEFNPASLTERRFDTRRLSRQGSGHRVEDLQLETAKNYVENAKIEGKTPEVMRQELGRIGLDPRNYEDMINSYGGINAPAGAYGRITEGVVPGNIVGASRQQPAVTPDFEGAVNSLLQSTNSWDTTVQHLVDQGKQHGATKGELTDKLMEHFGHVNPQLSTLVNKYWNQ